MSSNALLVITNGTRADTASLLVANKGAHLLDWLPKTPPAKDIIWASSPYQDGKHLISKTYDNTIDTFSVAISSLSMDNTIHELRRFFILLERAIKYWTDEYSTDKFWLEVRGECETNIRYAYAIDYGIPEGNNPFEEPFGTKESTLDEISISIEHTIWTDELEVGESCVAISAGVNADKTYGIAIDEPAASDDDATGWSGLFGIATTYLVIGSNAGVLYNSGIRFVGVAIPQYANILSAHIDFVCMASHVGALSSVTIYGENDSHPAVYSTWANFIARVRTLANKAWNAGPWVMGNTYSTPDITSIVQEIVKRGDWVSGHNIGIDIYGSASGITDTRLYASSWDNATYALPKLYVSWELDGELFHGEFDATCSKGPAVANYYRPQLITHAFWKDVSAPAWSGNLIAASGVDYNLWMAPVAALDELYVGIAVPVDATLVAPFNNFVVNLAAGGLTHVHREYWNGAAWVFMADVNLFNLGGGLHYDAWSFPTGAAVKVENGVNAYWIKYVNQAGAAIAPSQLANTIPYTISWPNIVIGNDQITGDIDAILNMLLMPYLNDPAYTDLCQNEIMISARKVGRDADSTFYPYIPMNVSLVLAEGTYVTIGAAGADTQDFTAYSGRCIRYSPGGAGTGALAHIYLNAKTYAGRYRMIVRGKSVAAMAVGEGGLYMQINTYAGTTQTAIAYNQYTGAVEQEWDLGIVTFPSDIIYEDKGTLDTPVLSHHLILYYNALGAYANADVYDVVLMPVDEAHVELHAIEYLLRLLNFQYPWKLVTTNPKVGSYGFLLYDRNGYPYQSSVDWNMQTLNQLKVDILGTFNLEKETAYNLYFYMSKDWGGNGLFSGIIAPVLDKNQRYLLYRGAE